MGAARTRRAGADSGRDAVAADLPPACRAASVRRLPRICLRFPRGLCTSAATRSLTHFMTTTAPAISSIPFRLDGKTALITGAGSGIGRAIALRFAQQGATVEILDLDEAAAQAVVKEIAAAGGKARAQRC